MNPLKLPVPPFAWPLLIGFLAAVFCAIFPPKFPLLGLSSHAFYGFLFLGFSLAAIVLGLILWLLERKRAQRAAAR